jgi:vitamin B12 transporter
MTGLKRRGAAARAAFPFALAIHAASGWAQGATQPAAQKPDVLVTASRAPESLDEVLWSSDVLTRSDIEASQSLSIQSLLAQLPGVQIDNTGGLGKQTSIFLRGTNSDQTLLLVDGVRVGSATTGLPPFELIPVDQIDHIEIVRGPRSTLYGADAVGGVIQVFTRDGARQGLSGDASVTGGTYSTFDETLSLRAGIGPAWLGASGEALHTAGFEACSMPPGAGSAPADCFGGMPDRDGYLNRSGSFTAGVRIGAAWTASFQSLLTSGHTDYDGSYSDSTEFAERVSSLHLDGRLGALWSLHAMAGRDVEDAHDFLAGASVDRFETRRDTASLQVDGSAFPALRLVAGTDWYGDHIGASQDFDGVASPILFERTSRDTTGTFIELHGATGRWTELAGVRYEHNTQYGDHFTEDFGVGRSLGRHYRVTATWGTAFHAPTFNDLYFPSFPGFPPSSNANLRPETSRSFELGVEGRFESGRWSLHAFQTDIRNLITYPPPDYTPLNLGAARIRGVELEGVWRHDAWSVSGELTGLDPIDHSPPTPGNADTRGNLLPRRARSSASLEVRRALWKSASLATRARWEGRRFDDLANTVPLGGYFLLDVLGDLTVGDGLSLEGRITNALGREYHTAAAIDDPVNPAYYNQAGREFDLTARYRLPW